MMKGVDVLAVLLFLFLETVEATKIAIIGGGISGSFAAKYLADYDENCVLESITIFEEFPVTDCVRSNRTTIHSTNATSLESPRQGSRVASFQSENGLIVELGASVLYKRFYLVSDMIREGLLEIGPPFCTGKEDPDLRSGIGIYDGNGKWPYLTATVPSYFKKFQMAYRYNWDLYKLFKITNQVMAKFDLIAAMLQSNSPETFFDSPEDIWKAVGLSNAVHASFDDLLDVLAISNQTSWWRKWLPYQGSLRNELLAASNLVNYNQDNAHVTALVGLGSFAAAAGGLFSVKGGNYQIIRSAVEQGSVARDSKCERNGTLHIVQKRITTVIGSLEGLTLFSRDEELGMFDIVILAAPLSMAQIEFLIQSHFDTAVVQPMPLAGLVNAHDVNITDEHEGHTRLPEPLPESAVRQYTQVVTTVIRNAVLQTQYLNIPENSLPKSVLMTVAGKTSTFNITAITQISSSGVYKTFSDDELPDEVLTKLFGSQYVVVYTKKWGGNHGGATPDYQGHGVATSFLLYDGATGFSGHTSSGALYYTSPMEQSSLSSMEICAIGAKAVAKLVAERVRLLQRRVQTDVRDEL
jgi:prenylcysteine oxidase/farnesylcysteine lyase